jgi:hypothetical protein
VGIIVNRFHFQHRIKDHFVVKVGGADRRKERLVGKVIVEHFSWEGGQGTRCVMKRDSVSFLNATGIATF